MTENVIFLFCRNPDTQKICKNAHNIDVSRHSNSLFFKSTYFTPAKVSTVLTDGGIKTSSFLAERNESEASSHTRTGEFTFRQFSIPSTVNSNFLFQTSLYCHVFQEFL